LQLTYNAYFDGSNWRYLNSASASNYFQAAGIHAWRTAPSGTAGNAISFTQAMTLFANGNLGLGTTSDNSFRLNVVSSSAPIATFTGAANGYIDITDGFVNSRIQNSGGLFIGTVNAYDFNLRTNATTRLNFNATTGLATFSNDVSLSGASGNRSLSIQTNTSGDPIFNLIAAGSDSGSIRYSRSTGELIFSNSGVPNALRIANTGEATFSSSVNIGGLNISGAIGGGPSLIAVFKPSNPSSVNSGYQFQLNPAGGAYGGFSVTNVDPGINQTLLQLAAQSLSGDSYINVPATGQNISLRVSGTPYFYLQGSTGNVGIGTTSPTDKLQMNGGKAIFATSNFNGTNAGGSVFVFSDDNNGGKIWAQKNGNSDWGYLALQPIGGNVGITTTGPATRLALGDYLGSRLPYINGTGNTFNAQGITVTSNNSGNSDIGGGLDLTNNIYSVGAISPVISFSSRSLNGNFNNNYAAIYGIFAGDGGEGNWTAGHLVFSTTESYGAKERVRITAAGDVGIGTTSPSSKLQVEAANNLLTLRMTSGGFNALTLSTTFGGGNNYAINPYISGVSNGGFEIKDLTNNVSRIAIAVTSGNVGIGTTTAFSRLTVNGALSQNTSQISLINSEGGHYIIRTGIAGIANQGLVFLSANQDGTGQTSRLVIDSSGNVGINTTNPIARLDVNGTGRFNTDISCVSTVGNSALTLRSAGACVMDVLNAQSEGYIRTTTYHDLYFRTNDINRMVISKDGNVGIGTTSPNALLDVYTSQGGSRIGATHGTGGAYPKASGISFGATSTGLTVSNNGGTTTFTGGAGIYASNGAASNNPTDLVFWTTSAGSPTTRLTIASGGAATFTSSVTATSFFESSDERLKSNIIDLDVNVSSIIAKSYLKDGVKEIGYIAQDVENILPSAVSIRDNGYLDLSYRQIHTAKIAALEKEVAELKKQLNNK
jgi:hypothetical protein